MLAESSFSSGFDVLNDADDCLSVATSNATRCNVWGDRTRMVSPILSSEGADGPDAAKAKGLGRMVAGIGCPLILMLLSSLVPLLAVPAVPAVLYRLSGNVENISDV
jgi:hypothetical protein